MSTGLYMAQDKKCELCGETDSRIIELYRIFSKNSPPAIRLLCKNCLYITNHGQDNIPRKTIVEISAPNSLEKLILFMMGGFSQVFGEIAEAFGNILLEMTKQQELNIVPEGINLAKEPYNVSQYTEEDKKCVLCGVNDNRLLEKHHTDGKNFSPNTVLLCKNCHYKITYEQNKITPKRRSKNATINDLVNFMLISEGVLFNEMGRVLKDTGEEFNKISKQGE